MDADRPLKELFRLRPWDLLALTGDVGADVVSTDVVELPSLSRRVDTVLRLRRGREDYIRHIEFEIRYKRGLEFRCFEYATRLVARFQVPVLTTVLFVGKRAPRALAHREVLDKRVVHERCFDVVSLWEMDPRRALKLGPGVAALIGPAEKATLPLVGQAARLIECETEGVVRADLLFILQALSRRRYTAGELAGVIPKEMVMASSLWAEAVSKGRKEGREEGRLEGAREVCADLVRRYHPDAADHVLPVIEACSDIERLHDWAVQAPQLPGSAFVKLVTEGTESPPVRTGRRRTPRPSRESKSRRSR